MSSGSEADAGGMIIYMDEKKRKRMLSNRESTKQSRIKKQKLLEDLVTEVACLKVDIGKNTDKFQVLMQKTVVLESENNVLMAQQTELAQFLRNLELLQMNLKQPARSFSDQSVESLAMPWFKPAFHHNGICWDIQSLNLVPC